LQCTIRPLTPSHPTAGSGDLASPQMHAFRSPCIRRVLPCTQLTSHVYPGPGIGIILPQRASARPARYPIRRIPRAPRQCKCLYRWELSQSWSTPGSRVVSRAMRTSGPARTEDFETSLWRPAKGARRILQGVPFVRVMCQWPGDSSTTGLSEIGAVVAAVAEVPWRPSGKSTSAVGAVVAAVRAYQASAADAGLVPGGAGSANGAPPGADLEHSTEGLGKSGFFGK
jgi:hypothetical protein